MKFETLQAVIGDRRLALFGHVRRLSEGTPAHDALQASPELSSGTNKFNNITWRRKPGRPQSDKTAGCVVFSRTYSSPRKRPGATFSKVPRKMLGKLVLGATDTQVATSSRGYSATVEHCTDRPINSVLRSNRKLRSSSSNRPTDSLPHVVLTDVFLLHSLTLLVPPK